MLTCAYCPIKMIPVSAHPGLPVCISRGVINKYDLICVRRELPLPSQLSLCGLHLLFPSFFALFSTPFLSVSCSLSMQYIFLRLHYILPSVSHLFSVLVLFPLLFFFFSVIHLPSVSLYSSSLFLPFMSGPCHSLALTCSAVLTYSVCVREHKKTLTFTRAKPTKTCSALKSKEKIHIFYLF